MVAEAEAEVGGRWSRWWRLANLVFHEFFFSIRSVFFFFFYQKFFFFFFFTKTLNLYTNIKGYFWHLNLGNESCASHVLNPFGFKRSL